MSRNITDNQPEKSLEQTLKSLTQAQSASRSLQPQGSQALEIQTLFGFQFLTIPDGSIATNSTYLTLSAINQEVLCIASLVHSAYVEHPTTLDEIVNADLEDHGIDDDTWKVWMTFDARANFGDAMEVDYEPDTTLEDRLLAQMSSTGVEPHQANIGFKYARMTSDARPADVGEIILFLYEIRILIG